MTDEHEQESAQPDALEKLRPFATPRQIQYIDAIVTHGSQRAAAKALGIGHRAIGRGMESLRSKAAMQGHAPASGMTNTVPRPFIVKGVSTLYDSAGNIAAQWVKSTLDQTQVLAALEEWVGWLVEDAKGKSPHVHAPVGTTDDLLAVYPMGDPHFGMLAWAQETGQDFDLEIAENLTRAAIDRLVEAAPPADTGLVINLGDFFHADDSTNRTPHGKNVLDVDGRYAKIMQVGLRCMVYVVLKTLERHKRVVVRNVAGNHDPHAAWALAFALDAYFSNEPRVKVELSPAPFWFYTHGSTLIGVCHGDGIKVADLGPVMAHDRPKEWGEAQFRYWYIGHVHHSQVKELVGVTVESFRTLASGDAWHNSKGYRSGRDMRCIVISKDHGEIERHRCDVAMLRAKK